MKRIDLHIHTTMSDGSFTPKQVIDEAVKNGVSTISIADHDTVEAYTEELFIYAASKNINIIRGVEISTKNSKVGIHVLGYNYDLENEEFKGSLKRIRNARHDYLHNVSKKLNELGYALNVEELDQIDSVTKAHIALDVISNKENEGILIKEFGHIPNKGEFIEAIMNENCPAYVRKESVTPKQAADLIHKAGGKVVLAHPVAYVHEDALTDEDILDIVNDMKPDGLEANYLYADKYNNKFDETKKWNEFAKEHNLFVTAGSDFHNKDGIRPEIGFVNTDFVLSEDTINEIIRNLSVN
jgi:predicted metal-dependent phosphoesterase TrpH